MPKAYSYLRFSTPEQMKGDSKRRQTQLAQQYAAAHGLELDDQLTFQDLGVSAFRGANVETGQLGAFLEAVRQKIVEPGSYLLVESLDRVSRRSARKAVRVLEEIVEAGVTVVTLNDGKRYTEESLDGLDFLIAIIILIRANEESETKSKRLRHAWQNKRANAKERVLTSITPAWIRIEDGRPVLIEERAAVVRRIFKEYLEGIGKESIARRLNRDNVPVFGRGGQWHRSYVQKILENTACIGTLTPHVLEHVDGRKVRKPQEPVPGYYPAVVDEMTFQRATDMAARLGGGRGRHAGKKVQSLFAGLASCPQCGATMTRVNKGSRSVPYMICVAAKAGNGCEYRSVRLSILEDALVAAADELVAEMPLAHSTVGNDIEFHEDQLRELDGRITRLVDDLEQGGASEALSKRLRDLEGQRDAVKAELEGLMKRAEREESKLVLLKARTLAEALKAQPLDRQVANAALRQCLERIVIDYRSGFLELHWLHGGQSAVLYTMPPSGIEGGYKVSATESPKSSARNS